MTDQKLADQIRHKQRNLPGQLQAAYKKVQMLERQAERLGMSNIIKPKSMSIDFYFSLDLSKAHLTNDNLLQTQKVGQQ